MSEREAYAKKRIDRLKERIRVLEDDLKSGRNDLIRKNIRGSIRSCKTAINRWEKEFPTLKQMNALYDLILETALENGVQRHRAEEIACCAFAP